VEGRGGAPCCLLDGCQYSGGISSVHLQDRRVVFYPVDGGSQFVRNFGTHTKLYDITFHKNMNNKCLDNLKYNIKELVFDNI
jgi:hypothetical protein